MFKKILWVTDFSQHAHDAGVRALECAQCSDGTLTALTIIDPEDLPFILEDVPDPFIQTDQIEQINRRLESKYEQRVLDQLKNEVQSLGPAKIPIETMLRIGTPWEEIVHVAEELGSTLIVLGSHGKRSLEEIILGSTVENVAKHAPCPVLVVR
jgi:nucleotide-binding universal stress UspA family protein